MGGYKLDSTYILEHGCEVGRTPGALKLQVELEGAAPSLRLFTRSSLVPRASAILEDHKFKYYMRTTRPMIVKRKCSLHGAV